jgi:hypothetical protein
MHAIPSIARPAVTRLGALMQNLHVPDKSKVRTKAFVLDLDSTPLAFLEEHIVALPNL